SGNGSKDVRTVSFRDKMSLSSGRSQIDLYYFGAGHTNGDTIVVLPAQGIAYLGDLFPGKYAPVIDVAHGGSGVAFPDTLSKAMAEIKGIDLIVTGHSEPPNTRSPLFRWVTWNDVRDYADFNRDVLAAVRQAMESGKSAEAAAESLKLAPKYKDYG